MTQIDDIKARLDIVDVVSGYVPELKKMGRSWKARCPFHSERTPSFVVDQERQTWHCFGSCSTGGDVIEFVRRQEGLDFKEALRLCAERAGVELRAPSQREVAEREVHERLLAANEAAAVYFQAALAGPEGAEARAYCESRGLDATTIETWQLGYAPDGWSGLIDHLVTRGFKPADLMEAGLAIEGDRGAYDRFRARLMFPTRDARRRLIGFGARAMRPGDEPKYLNTPQTPLFEKSANLYGLDRAADDIRRQDRAVVVEGYMDVIAAHQFGVTNVVASNGTAITEKQMELLKRYTHNVVLALDADNAGSAATLRGVEVATGVADRRDTVSLGFGGLVSYQEVLDADIRVVALPAGEDPDSLVRKDADRFRTLLGGAKPVLDHLFEVTTAGVDPADARARSHAVEQLLPYLARIGDEVVRASYVQKVARFASVDEATVGRMLAAHRQQALRPAATPRPVPTPAEVKAAKKATAEAIDPEIYLLALMFQRPEARAAGESLSEELFLDSARRALFRSWKDDIDLVEKRALLDLSVASVLDEALTAWADRIPLIDARQVGDAIRSIARTLEERRTKAALRSVLAPESREYQQVRQERPELTGIAAGIADRGAVSAEIQNEDAEIAAGFVERVTTMRDVVAKYSTGRRPVEAGDPRDGSVA